MGFCSIRQQYSPELVRERAIGSPAALAGLAARGAQISWEVGLFLAGLWWDGLQGAADDSVRVKYRATQLRDLLTRLGPTFIKAGQARGAWGHGAGSQRGRAAAGCRELGPRRGEGRGRRRWAPVPWRRLQASRGGAAAALTPLPPPPWPPPRPQVLANRPDIVREDYMNE